MHLLDLIRINPWVHGVPESSNLYKRGFVPWVPIAKQHMESRGDLIDLDLQEGG